MQECSTYCNLAKIQPRNSSNLLSHPDMFFSAVVVAAAASAGAQKGGDMKRFIPLGVSLAGLSLPPKQAMYIFIVRLCCLLQGLERRQHRLKKKTPYRIFYLNSYAPFLSMYQIYVIYMHKTYGLNENQMRITKMPGLYTHRPLFQILI